MQMENLCNFRFDGTPLEILWSGPDLLWSCTRDMISLCLKCPDLVQDPIFEGILEIFL